MSEIILTNHTCSSMTVVSNSFIDHYMPKASGDYIKVYLYLLRCAGAGLSVNIPMLADNLHQKEADVTKSLRYWEQESLLHLTLDRGSQILSIQLLPIQMTLPDTEDEITSAEEDNAKPQLAASMLPDIPSKTSYTPKDLEQRMEEKGLSQIIYVTETYLRKTLTPADLNSLFYFYDDLHFSMDMIEYLIEYCVDLNKKSMRYIETVAISWFESGIDTVKKAKESVKSYNKNYFSVMKAFGIASRNPGQAESDYIKKWLEEYSFSLDIILEACNRTITSIAQPSFPYTDSILKGWLEANVHTISDIKNQDTKHQSKKKLAASAPKTTNAPNKFHNFNQRSYDYADLEQRFINKANGISTQNPG